MKNKMLIEFEMTAKELLHVLELFRQDTINEIPYANSWSAAQVGDHLIKSDRRILEILSGPKKNAEGLPDEKVAELRKTFLDFSTKMQTPEYLRPGIENFSKHDLIESIKTTRKKMVEALHPENLSETFSTPEFGDITRLELLYFVIFHTQRHIRQIKNIFVAMPLENGNSFPY